jgi:hypothetical protein
MHIRTELFRRGLARQFAPAAPDPAATLWCVIRPQPSLRSVVVARFPSRSKAEAHLSFLKRSRPDAAYEIMFDAATD